MPTYICNPVTCRASYPVSPPHTLNWIFSSVFGLIPNLVDILKTHVQNWTWESERLTHTWSEIPLWSQTCSEQPGSTSTLIAIFRITSRGLDTWKVQQNWDLKHVMMPKYCFYLPGVAEDFLVALFSTSGSISTAL